MLRIIYTISAIIISLCSMHAQEIKVIAHRGYWNCEEAGYAKNSIAALVQAQEKGFWGSEFDVNMTADGELLVIHDSKIDGMQIESHHSSCFEDYKLENGEPIPTLDAYLEQGAKAPGTKLVLELKKHSTAEVETKAVEKVIEKLKAYGLYSPQRVMFISFSHHACREFVRLAPGFDVQYLGFTKSPASLAKEGISGIDYNYMTLLAYPASIREAKRNGMDINAWTIRKIGVARKLIDKGIGYITTDIPEEIQNISR